MLVHAVTNFCHQLDKVICEECREERVLAVAQKCFPDYRLACDVTIYESLKARLEQEFQSELRNEIWKNISKDQIDNLKTEYCIVKAIDAADEAVAKAWSTLEKSKPLVQKPVSKKWCSIS
jgi:hypothetical protein